MKNIFYMSNEDQVDQSFHAPTFTFSHKQQVFKSIGQDSKMMTMDSVELSDGKQKRTMVFLSVVSDG
jgi:hypothetical protein